ncbi:MAG: hypothetical protein IJM02_06960 [Clostridia bacterium]|nr:hypothetical protein [Clostridia bacterium]
MDISFNGFGSNALTFLANEKIPAGTLVGLTDNGTVGPCENSIPLGQVLNGTDTHACVCVRGVITAPCDPSLPVGPVCLACDSHGALCEAEDGVMKYVLSVDTDNSTAEILL